MKKWIVCQKIVQLNCQKYFFQFILHFIWFWFEFNEMSRETKWVSWCLKIGRIWAGKIQGNMACCLVVASLSCTSRFTKKVLLICSKILKNCNLNKKLYRSTYFLPQKLKFMIIFCRQHLTHYYCQHILYQDLNLTFYAKFGRLDI